MIQTFGAQEQLAAVRLYIDLNRTDGVNDPYTLMTTFPKRVFSLEDYDKPLSMLGKHFVLESQPSSALMLTCDENCVSKMPYVRQLDKKTV